MEREVAALIDYLTVAQGRPDEPDSTVPELPHIHIGRITIERRLDSLTVAEISYAGSRGTHLPRKYDINQQIRTDPQRIVRPYPQFNGAIQYVALGSSSFPSFRGLPSAAVMAMTRGMMIVVKLHRPPPTEWCPVSVMDLIVKV